LGSELNEESYLFEQIIVNETPIALALDQDMWFTKTPLIAKKLSEYSIDTVVVKLTKSDPGSMSKQEFEDALELATNLSWKDNVLNRLQICNVRLKL
jgi:hypothetical protein